MQDVSCIEYILCFAIGMPVCMIGFPMVLQRCTGEPTNADTTRGLAMIRRNIALTVVPVALFTRAILQAQWVDLQPVGGARVAAETLVVLVLVDTLFYFAHRALHTPLLYRWHRSHHTFRPTQTTCYVAMSLTEFVVENLTYFLMAPVGAHLCGHRIHLLSWACANAYTLLHGAAVHNAKLTVDLSAYGLNSPPQHQLHHKYGQKNANFGLLFTVWDQLLGTSAPNLSRVPRTNRPTTSTKITVGVLKNTDGV